MEASGIKDRSGRRASRVLLVCATKFGSSLQVAEAIAEELRQAGYGVELRGAREGVEPSGFDAVVVGGPMIFGWHKDATRYVQAHRHELARLPVVYFITAASLTEDGAQAVEGITIVKDPRLATPPRRPGKLGYRERHARPGHYLGDILSKTKPVRPRQVSFFAGAVDLMRMNLWQKVFVLLLVRASPGDRRDWDAIRGWAAGLPAVLGLTAAD